MEADGSLGCLCLEIRCFVAKLQGHVQFLFFWIRFWLYSDSSVGATAEPAGRWEPASLVFVIDARDRPTAASRRRPAAAIIAASRAGTGAIQRRSDGTEGAHDRGEGRPARACRGVPDGAMSEGRAYRPVAAGAQRVRSVPPLPRTLFLSALAGLVVVAAGAASSGGGATAAGAARPATQAWSAPAVLASCGRAVGPLVAFPSQGPSIPAGAGAIVWAAPSGSCSGAEARTHGEWALSVAAIGAGDVPAPARSQPLGTSRAPSLSAVGAGLGRLTVLAAAEEPRRTAIAVIGAQGRAGAKRWSQLATRSSSAPALARAYLGDVAIAAARSGRRLDVRVQRHNSREWGATRSIPLSPGPVTALTATMDYRADVLLAWQQNGAVYAHMLRISGRSDPTQRLGPSGPDPQLQAVVSDNSHGMVAWSTTDTRASTRVYLSLSRAGVRFPPPRLLAEFADPLRIGSRAGSLQIQRLSTENVMLAWTVAENGHYEVRAAPAVFAGSRPSTLLTDPASQAALAGLAPGGAHEAIALWSAAPASAAAGSGASGLWAARLYIRHSAVLSEAPQRIAAGGPILAPAVAVDPANDRAVAAWRRRGSRDRIEYALGPARPGYRPLAQPPARARAGGGPHWLRIGAGALALLAAVGLLAAWRAARGSRLRQP